MLLFIGVSQVLKIRILMNNNFKNYHLKILIIIVRKKKSIGQTVY